MFLSLPRPPRSDPHGKFCIHPSPTGTSFTMHLHRRRKQHGRIPNSDYYYDTIDDGDHAYDVETAVDGITNVTLEPSQTDAGNDFLDSSSRKTLPAETILWLWSNIHGTITISTALESFLRQFVRHQPHRHPLLQYFLLEPDPSYPNKIYQRNAT
jgi:hypothetical protein